MPGNPPRIRRGTYADGLPPPSYLAARRPRGPNAPTPRIATRSPRSRRRPASRGTRTTPPRLHLPVVTTSSLVAAARPPASPLAESTTPRYPAPAHPTVVTGCLARLPAPSTRTRTQEGTTPPQAPTRRCPPPLARSRSAIR